MSILTGKITFTNIPVNASQKMTKAQFQCEAEGRNAGSADVMDIFLRDPEMMMKFQKFMSFVQSKEEVIEKCYTDGFMSLMTLDNEDTQPFLQMLGITFANDHNYYKDMSNFNELIYENYQNYIKQIYLTKQLTTLNSEYDNGLIRKLSPKGCLGIFANKKFKKGESITRYGTHFIHIVNDSGNSRMEYDKNVFDVEIYNEDGSGLQWFRDRKLGDYHSDLYNGLGDFSISAAGSPHPDLNKDQRFWGHLLNDLAYNPNDSAEEYESNKHKNNTTIGVRGDLMGQLELQIKDIMMGKSKNKNTALIPIFFDRLNLVAKRTIKKGEELGCMYGTQYWYNEHTDRSCKNRHLGTYEAGCNVL
jgi:hypothetical protein